MKKGKNILIAQSGGPTAVINSSVVGAIKCGLKSEEVDKVYAAHGGIEGVLNQEFFDMTTLSEKVIDGLRKTPSAGLGSCRYKLSKDIKDPEYAKIFEIFKAYDIGYFFYNGGNDSMDTCDKINDYAVANNIPISVMGIPKTVDNDLVMTDHCPGFGSAAKYINTTLTVAAYDCYSYTTPTIILMETMGRHAGWLAASAACAEYDGKQIADRIYLPEMVFDLDEFMKDTEELFKTKGMVFIVVSEGIKDKNGDFLLAGNSVNDKFGHSQLGGVTGFLQEKIAEKITSRVKVINPNIIQRCATHVASETDWVESYWLGYTAAKEAIKGNTGCMAGVKRLGNEPYRWEPAMIPLCNVANAEKMIPAEWINDAQNHVTQEVIDYTRPLMEGEVNLEYKDGLPVFTKLDWNFVEKKL